jgi:hypothetical protein
MVIVALATFDSELYATFPATVSVICNLSLLFLTFFSVLMVCFNIFVYVYLHKSVQMTPLDASTSADLLSRSLRHAAPDLFQMM